MRALRGFLGLPLCLRCLSSSSTSICPSCLRDLHLKPIEPLEYKLVHERIWWKRGWYLGGYASWKPLIRAVKFHRVLEGLEAMIEVMGGFLSHLPRYTVVTWVPRADEEVRDELDLGKELAMGLRRWGVTPLKLLRKVRVTPRQASLRLRERLNNLRDAFEPVALLSELRERQVLLVDDVITTGSTLNEVSKVLKSSGVEVDVYVFAKSSLGG